MTGPRIGTLVIILLFCAAFAAGCSAFSSTALAAQLSSQSTHRNIPPEAGPSRPSTVPSGYVITPFGYFDPSCVQSLAKGDRLLNDGRVEHADGTEEGYIATCNSPHYTATGTMMKTNQPTASSPLQTNLLTTPLPEITGWLESANVLSGNAATPFGALLAIWKVPPSPSAQDGQVLFFFTGFEDIANTQSILQPVLQWNQGQWSIASWNCCLNGITTSSPAINVNTGDEIYGSITNNCAPGTASCANWNVLSLDLSTGESTTLANTPSQGQTFNWAFGSVLEVYSATRCADYPSDRNTKFKRITLFDENLQPITTPPWSGNYNSTVTPQCHYGVETEAQKITLLY